MRGFGKAAEGLDPGRGTAPPQRHASGFVLFIRGASGDLDVKKDAGVLERLRRAGVHPLVLEVTPAEGRHPEPGEIVSSLDTGIRRALKLVDGLQREGEGPVGLGVFGSGFGGPVALSVAAHRPEVVKVVVCRGGPADLKGDLFSILQAPVLFFSEPVAKRKNGAAAVAEVKLRHPVLEMYGAALDGMTRMTSLEPRTDLGPWFLFQEEGSAEQVIRDAWVWFQEHLFSGEAWEEDGSWGPPATGSIRTSPPTGRACP